MKILICDDEQEYLDDIVKHVNQYLFDNGLFSEIKAYTDSDEVLNDIDYYDIAFLDIEMNGKDGLYIGKQLKKVNPNIVLIYITAYEHYLDDALDLGSIRFFDKPIDSQRFYKGFEKAVQKIDSAEIKCWIQDVENGVDSLNTNDVIYVEIKGRKTLVVTRIRNYYSNDSLKTWKSRLNKSYFVSPHSSYIINANYITYFRKDHVILDSKYYIPVAYAKRAEFKKKIFSSLEN